MEYFFNSHNTNNLLVYVFYLSFVLNVKKNLLIRKHNQKHKQFLFVTKDIEKLAQVFVMKKEEEKLEKSL